MDGSDGDIEVHYETFDYTGLNLSQSLNTSDGLGVNGVAWRAGCSIYGYVNDTNLCNTSTLGAVCSDPGRCIVEMPVAAEPATQGLDYFWMGGVLRWKSGDSTSRTISLLLGPKAGNYQDSSYPGFKAFGVRLVNATSWQDDSMAQTISPFLPESECCTKEEGNCGHSSVAYISVSKGGRGFFRAFATANRVLEGSANKILVVVQRIGGSLGNVSVQYECMPAYPPYLPFGAVPGNFPQEFQHCKGGLWWDPGDSSERVVEIGLVSDNTYVQGRYARAVRLSLTSPSLGSAIDPDWNGVSVVVFDDDIGRQGTVMINEGDLKFLEPALMRVSVGEPASSQLFEENLATVCCPNPNTDNRTEYFAPYTSIMDFSFANRAWSENTAVSTIAEQIGSSCGENVWIKHGCYFAMSSACMSDSERKVDRVMNSIWLAVVDGWLLNVAPNISHVLLSPYPSFVSTRESYSNWPSGW